MDNWKFYIAYCNEKYNNSQIIYVDIIKDITNIKVKHEKYNTIIKLHTTGITNYYEVPIKLNIMTKENAEIYAHLFACILKFNLPQYKFYSQFSKDLYNDINNNIIINDFETIFKNQMNYSFYENFDLFLDIVIKNSIQIGNDAYKFIMPTKMDNGDVVMWNYSRI
jgi:hypothetical protein